MADTEKPTSSVVDAPTWDAKLVDFALGDSLRRRLLIALAHGKPRAASELTGNVQRSLDAISKRLIQLRAKGFITMVRDPGDRRRMLCTLAASVPVRETPSGKVMDFGFIAIPIRS